MNLLNTFASEDWQTLANSLLHTLWQGAIAALALAAILRWIPSNRPRARYTASLATLTLLLLAAFITWACLDYQAQRPSVAEASEPISIEEEHSPATSQSASTPATQISPAQPAASPIDYRAVIIATWLLGVAIMFIRMAYALQAVDMVRRNCQPVTDRSITGILDQLLDSTAAKERRIRLLVADHLSGPIAMGFFWPAIILPTSLMTGTAPESLRAIIAHELAHIRRHDYLVNLGQMLVETLLFFNPAVWWISRQIRIEREACCDAEAARLIGDELEYADVLTSYAESQATTPALAPAFSEEKGGSSLGDRVRRLLIPGYQPRLRLPLQGLLFFLLIGSITLIALHQGSRIAVAAGAQLLSPKERIEKIREIQNTHAHRLEEKAYPRDLANKKESQVAISGTIVDEAGNPVDEKDVQLHARVERSGYTGSHTLNNDTGSFVDSIGPGRIHITAWGRGKSPKYATTMIGPLDGKIGGKIENIKIVMKKGYTSQIQLLDQSGKPISNATIDGKYEFPSWANVRQVETDTNGIATFYHLTKHPITFTANAPGFQEEHTNFTLEQDQITAWKLNPASPTTIHIVTDEGKPIAGATARLLRKAGAVSMGYAQGSSTVFATSDANGVMEMNGLRDDTVYWFIVEADGHRRAILREVIPGDTNRVFHLGSQLIVSGTIDGDLSQLRTRSKRQKNGKRARVPYLNYSNPFKVHNHSSSYTEYTFVNVEDGKAHFRITNLWAGDITLYIGTERVRKKLTHSLTNLQFTLKAPAKKPETKSGELAPLPERTVIFSFNTPPGNPPAQGDLYTVVDRKRPDGGSDWQELRVPVSNNVASISVPVGSKIRCEPRDFTGYWFDGTDHTAIEAGTAPVKFELTCVPAGALYGSISEADGSPAKGVLISLVEVERAPGRKGSLDVRIKNSASGSDRTKGYNATPLPLGGTYMVVAHRGMNYAVTRPHQVTRENPLRKADLVMREGITVKGRVVGSEGNPVPGAKFSLGFSPEFGSHGFGTSDQYTDRLGRFILRDVVPNIAGKYRFNLQTTPGWQKTSVEFKPEAGKDVTIRLEYGRRLGGKIVDAKTGWPIPGVEVYALPRPHSTGRSGYIDADAKTNERGEFEFTTMDDGDYELGVRSGSFSQPDSTGKRFTKRVSYKVRGDFTPEKTYPMYLSSWSKLKPVDPKSSASAR